MNFLDSNFKIIAYRGGARLFPENSIEAIQDTLSVNPTAIIELDLQLTKDNCLVAFHDFHLNNLTNGNGKVSEFSLQELQKLFLKSPDKTCITQSKISILSEIFKLFPKQLFVLDLHENNKMLIEKVIETVTEHNFQEQIAIVSIADGVISEFKKLKPDWVFVASPQETKKFIFASKLLLDQYVTLTTDIMFLPYKVGILKVINSRMVKRLHKRNIKIWSSYNFKPYENVNIYDHLIKLKELGIDGVYTDIPRQINRYE